MYTWKSLAFRWLLLLSYIVGLDIAVGLALPPISTKISKGELLGVYNQVIKVANVETFAMGSSRAFAHYDPAVFSQKTTFLNAGINGQGLLMARALLDLSDKRVGNIVFDAMFFKDEVSRLSALHPYYGVSAIADQVMNIAGWRERLKLCSHIYRYSSTILPVVSNWTWSFKPDTMRFNPLPVRATVNFHVTDTQFRPEPWWWAQLDVFINEVSNRNCKLYIIVSPIATDQYDVFFDELLRRYSLQVTIIDERDRFERSSVYFNDTMHLNEQAARQFSEYLVGRIF